MPIVGTRKNINPGEGYKKDHMYGLASQYSRLSRDILTENQTDIYSDMKRALMQMDSKQSLKNFFVNESADPSSMDPEEYDDHVKNMEELYENDCEGMLEYASLGTYNPVMGITFPMHKNILMNCVFDKAIPKFVATTPKFTISMEKRLLVTPDGREIDMFTNQMDISKEVEASAPFKEIEIKLPEVETTDVLTKIGAGSVDNLSITTHISAVKVEVNAAVEGETVTESDGKHYRWVPVNLKFKPGYGELERTLIEVVDLSRVKDLKSETKSDTISGIMHKNKFRIQSYGIVVAVKLRAKKDTSNGLNKNCSVKWGATTELEEIPEATPVSVAISPEESKDISALYNVNQLTKLMSLMDLVLSNNKDDGIKNKLDESFKTMDPAYKVEGKFDFEPRQGYALDDVEWRHKVFFDVLDTFVSSMYDVLQDPNVVVNVVGRPDLIRKITPTEYSYTSPNNIGPVELNFNKTVVTSDKRVYNFMSSQKIKNDNNLIITLHPRNTERIIYRIYDYQLYCSNEVKDATYYTLPAVTAFERWHFVDYQPVQGRIEILNPCSLLKK